MLTGPQRYLSFHALHSCPQTSLHTAPCPGGCTVPCYLGITAGAHSETLPTPPSWWMLAWLTNTDPLSQVFHGKLLVKISSLG